MMMAVMNQTPAPRRIANSARSPQVGSGVVAAATATIGAPMMMVTTKVICITQR